MTIDSIMILKYISNLFFGKLIKYQIYIDISLRHARLCALEIILTIREYPIYRIPVT